MPTDPNLWDLVPAAVGAIIGAAAAAIPTYFFAKQAAQDAAAARQEAEVADLKSRAISLFVSFEVAFTTSRSLLASIHANMKPEMTEGIKLQLWQRYGALASLTHPERISPNDLTVLFAIGEPQLARAVAALSVRYAINFDTLEAYHKRFDEMQDLLELTTAESGFVYASVREGYEGAYTALGIELDTTLSAVLTNLAVAVADGTVQLDRLQMAFRDYFRFTAEDDPFR